MFKLSSVLCGKLCCYTVNLPCTRKLGVICQRGHIMMKLAANSSILENLSQYETSEFLTIKRDVTTELSSKEAEEHKSEGRGDIDITSLVDDLFEKTMERDRMIVTVPKSSVSKHVITLLNAGLEKSDVLDLHKFPDLIKNLSPLTEVITLFLDYGILKEDITKIVHTYPNILHKTKTAVLCTVDSLHEMGFSSESILKMICKYPLLLDSDLSGVPQRAEDLKLLFKTKDTFTLLEKSPTLLFCDMGYIMERFNYVFYEMGITQPQMRHSELFSYPMEHIHARHLFVERAGFFKKVKKKKGQLNLNPKLESIIDTSDAVFVKKFGNMSVQDYLTFKKLLLKDRVVMKDVEDYPED